MRRQQALAQLQLAVIQRLRDAGYITVADCALDTWSHGEHCPLPNVISTPDAELRAEYEQANAFGPRAIGEQSLAFQLA